MFLSHPEPYAANEIELLSARNMCSNEESKPHVLVIVTGGTICMTHEGVDSSLRPASLSARLKEIVTSADEPLPICSILEWNDLIDSSDINLSHWVHIAKDIENNYGNYDGFVILHGTDTLAYTASALSFMLENLNKPVILTGAMLPLHHIQTDARKNFAVALMVAAYSQLTEVCILFGSRLLRGNRATKVDCSRMDAFKSPNFPPLGSIGVDIRVDEQLALTPSKRGFKVFSHFCMNIVIITITPGFQSTLLRSLFSSTTRPLAIILKFYGSGTAPTSSCDLLDILREGLEAGIEVVCVSQCVAGTCSLLTYENGAKYYHIGLIEGKDITIEAAFTKLGYLLGKGYSGEKLRYLMETDIRGEVTDHPSKVTGQAPLAQPKYTATNNFAPVALPCKKSSYDLTLNRKISDIAHNNDEHIVYTRTPTPTTVDSSLEGCSPVCSFPAANDKINCADRAGLENTVDKLVF